MADIEVVIKISEEDYKRGTAMASAIRNGTPLPKGHGRLIDADALRCENADFDTYNDYCTMFDEIDIAPTIIEADKGETE